jgi:ribosomal protein S10
MPIGDRPVPTRRTHFTVISGPHVHKTAREQFVRTSHIRVVSVSTNNLAELDWLLHSIKMYK